MRCIRNEAAKMAATVLVVLSALNLISKSAAADERQPRTPARPAAVQHSATQAAPAGSPTRILVNGKILTMDASDRVAEALAIKDSEIVAVGSNADIKKLAGPETSVVDLGGRTVIPGLNDSHLHFIRAGQTYHFETYWYDASTLQEALGQLKTAAAERGPDKWVAVAGSWSPAQFKENRAPTVEELNKLLPDNPAYVEYMYDYAIVNQKGLQALGLDKEGASMPGIVIEKDAEGRPTGKLTGTIAGFSGLFARISASSDEERKESLAEYIKVLNSRGVTAVVDAGGGGSVGAIYDPLFALWREHKLAVRVSYRVSAQKPGGEAEWLTATTAYMPPLLGDGMLKFLGLGELLVFQAFDGTRLSPGFQIQKDGTDELYKVAMLAAHRKYPLEIHAYTNDTAKQILDVFERVAQSGVDLHPLHWCIAHISTGTADTFARMAKLGICYSVQMQPYYEAPEIAASNGQAVAEASPPVRLALDAGLRIVGGTDSTRVGEYNTWKAIEYLITGTSAGGAVQRRADYSITRSQALRFYTANGGWLTFEEGRRGTLETGRVADLAVLDKPFLTIPLNEIHTIKSLLTLVDGKVVWSQGPFESVREASAH
jgi:predicted amidohydrolase YtcJ